MLTRAVLAPLCDFGGSSLEAGEAYSSPQVPRIAPMAIMLVDV